MSRIKEGRSKETRKDRLALARRMGVGRTSAFGAIAGVLVAYAAFAVLVGVSAAVVQALGISVDLADREWWQVGAGAGIAAGMLLFVAYLFGGYVSGRMARRAGLTNGLLVFIGGLVVAGATVGVVQVVGDGGEALDRLRESLTNLGVPTSGGQWGDMGTVAGIAALAGMFLGSVLGGGLGERWHAKLARTALETDVRDVPVETEHRDFGDQAGSDASVRTEAAVEALEERVEALQERVDALQGSAATRTGGERVPTPASAGDTEAASKRPARNGDTSPAEGEDLVDLTKAELYQQAQEAEVPGRSHMNKDALIHALSATASPESEDADIGEEAPRRDRGDRHRRPRTKPPPFARGY
jgi:hypothetical protein